MMSALPPKADITERDWNVCFVPKADIDVLLRAHGGTAEVAATASGKQDQSRRETLLLGMREEHGCDANV
jgi:hypothetical protein